MFERRLKLLLLATVAAMAVVAGRLAHLQLVRYPYYRALAERMLLRPQLLPTPRGRILDRHGLDLAMDRASYDVALDYGLLELIVSGEPVSLENDWCARQVRRMRRADRSLTAEDALERLGAQLRASWRTLESLGAGPGQDLLDNAARAVARVRAIRRVVGAPVAEEHQPHPVLTGLGIDPGDGPRLVALQEALRDMPGTVLLSSHRRWYPHGPAACHMLGLLGAAPVSAFPDAPTVEDLVAGYFEGDDRGVAGVEKACEDLLRGRRGHQQVHRDGSVVDVVPAQPGRDVHLTVDIQLQEALEGLLEGNGAIVVLDVPTGEVLALVSVPTFDLNRYGQLHRMLSADRVNLPLWNRAVSFQYAPGSTFKPFAALAALAEGHLTAATRIDCPGYLVRPDYPAFRCWTWSRGLGGHGSLSVVEALEHSCNVFFYKAGERLGVRRLNEWLSVLGFGAPTGVGLPGERGGSLPDPAAVQEPAESRFLAMGQGTVLATPLQVANAMAAIARGAYRPPVLLREQAAPAAPRPLTLKGKAVSPEALELVREGMYRVVNSPTGTAHKYAYDPAVAICGKTGTAQTSPRRVDTDGDGVAETVLEGDTVWFAGFAPYRQPRIAFAVVLDFAQRGGGASCGPVGREVVRLCRQRGYLAEAPARAD